MANERDRREAVQRMQDHIEEHLSEPMTLQELARCAGYSPYHAGRVFKEFTGKNLFDYIRLRRLSAAAEMLRDGHAKIVDVAFDFVFDSHEGFTRAFSRHFGMTPSSFRKSGASVSLFMPEQMRDYYANKQEGALSMSEKKRSDVVFVQVLERPERRLILKRGTKATHYFEYCEEVGCEVWEELVAIKDALHEPMGLWLPEVLRPANTSTYVQGVEVPHDYGGEVPDGFDMVDLPACKMMVFQGQPFDDADFEQAIASLWEVINSYDPKPNGFTWADEDAPRFQLEPRGYRGYIEGRPVRSVA